DVLACFRTGVPRGRVSGTTRFSPPARHSWSAREGSPVASAQTLTSEQKNSLSSQKYAFDQSQLDHLSEVIEHVSHLLPAQGPITVFIHHNTLHAFEEWPFHEAVKKAAHVFGCHPYLSEDRYRAELARGRIRF